MSPEQLSVPLVLVSGQPTTQRPTTPFIQRLLGTHHFLVVKVQDVCQRAARAPCTMPELYHTHTHTEVTGSDRHSFSSPVDFDLLSLSQ